MSANDYVDLTPKCKCGFAYNLPDATACRQCGAPYPPKGSKAARARAMARGELPAGGGQHEPRGGAGRTHLLVAAGAEHALTPGQVFTIGRSEDCSLSIPSKRVSRQHTEVSWRSGLPVLRNVSSTNQTKVNGRSIKEHELRDGDEIQIGPYEMTYRGLRPGQEAEAVADDGRTIVDEGQAVAGNLNQFSLADLLGSFEQQQKTGTIEISTDEDDGQIVVENGAFVSASFANQTGEAAVLSMLGLDEGLFQISNEAKAAPMKIMRSFDYHASGPGRARDLKRIKISELIARGRKQEAERPTTRQPARGRPAALGAAPPARRPGPARRRPPLRARPPLRGRPPRRPPPR